MSRLIPWLLPLILLLTGCYTNIQAPGALGYVVDAESGAPVKGAHVTRPLIFGGSSRSMAVPEEGLPAATVLSDKRGRFDLPPASDTRIAFMYHHNLPSLPGSFVISANGYATIDLQGIAISRTLWRVDLGRVMLRRP
jgi:hypothetical protein